VIYVDANVVIRLVEGDAVTRAPIEARLRPLSGTSPYLLTSRLTRMECRVKPLRAGNASILALFDTFFAGSELQLLEVSAAVVEKATELRAVFNFKTPDALHLASAVVAGATAFLTGGKSLAKCIAVPVEVL
jgi:predicted nucleic acid-binding protein